VENQRYTGIAGVYDATRVVPPEVFRNLSRCLCQRGIITPSMALADIGCGTGQYLVVLSDLVASAVGVDISSRMLELAAEKTTGKTNVSLLLSDATRLSLADDEFDVTISSKLFLHITEWQRAIEEVVRITKNGGHFVYVNEIGYFTNDLREHFRECCRNAGLSFGFAGEYDLDRIRAAFEERGCDHETIASDDLGWKRRISYRDAYEELKARAFAEFTAIDDQVYAMVLTEVADWVAGQTNGWDYEQTMTPHLRVDVYRIRE
jgi:ubiquinone/menaquinone biosynthesis C-methylase UbiE